MEAVIPIYLNVVNDLIDFLLTYKTLPATASNPDLFVNINGHLT